MTLGVTVTTRTAPPARGGPTATDTLFVTGLASAGSTTAATEVRSLADFVAAYSDRAGVTIPLYDYVDNFFREGGRRAFVSRYTTTAYAAGLALFSKDLGPGQVAVVGATTDATLIGALTTHGLNNNRVALIDVASGATVSQVTTAAGLVRADGHNDYGLLVGEWITIPAPAGVIGGSTRSVPGSSTVAALIARVDALGNPNRAAAGRDFPLQYATALGLNAIDSDRETLLNAGANVFANKYGVLQFYGFQTGIAQSSDTPFWQANCSRARMWLTARAQAAGEQFMFKPIDGKGRLASALKTELDVIGLELYGLNGLYGDTPGDAFSNQVGVSVNTVSTIAQGELHAVMEARLSLHAKSIQIELVSVPVTGHVSADV